ncbi:MAG: hypothetical protein SO373_01280 [Candidatus Borkfalkiaceae bacterium]|nr:hypothetical protein [Christensenellaceae bacterium]
MQVLHIAAAFFLVIFIKIEKILNRKAQRDLPVWLENYAKPTMKK